MINGSGRVTNNSLHMASASISSRLGRNRRDADSLLPWKLRLHTALSHVSRHQASHSSTTPWTAEPRPWKLFCISTFLGVLFNPLSHPQIHPIPSARSFPFRSRSLSTVTLHHTPPPFLSTTTRTLWCSSSRGLFSFDSHFILASWLLNYLSCIHGRQLVLL